VILATTGLVWSLSLAGNATYPLASSRANAQAPRRRAAVAHPLRVTALLAIFFLPIAAHATSTQGVIAIGKWKAMDFCAIEAQRAFPDFNAESNARRDAKLKECLALQNLPPREPATPAR
jgi:hypothetical protein